MSLQDSIVIETELDPSCCGGALFLSNDIIDTVPLELASKISNQEWSECMRSLQSITLNDSPSACCQIFASVCCGLIGYFVVKSQVDDMRANLANAVSRYNKVLFEPKGLHLAIQSMGADCCSPGTSALVISAIPKCQNI
jgi:hypothetical protein